MNDQKMLADVPIALVGLGGLFPKSANLQEFWGNVVDAADCMQDVPESHWRISDHYDPDPGAPDKTYAKRGGFVPEIAFNPMEFGLPPNTLEVTDVLQLLSLVVAKQTLADAGVADADWYDPSRTGVVLGITGANSLTQPLSARLQTPVLKEVVRSCGLTEEDAEQIAAKFVAAYAPWEENSFPGMLGNVVAGRIANRFDLGGMNCTVDAACASSLAAVRMAVSELVSGRADLMITGGCDAENTILMYMCFSKTPAFSRSGNIRPFDEESDGTLIGEGIGMLALKRLADAERDGDRIYSVLRGIGTSSDGRFKSIYAPRREGQMVALRRAYADARIEPETVGLVECHGTGTSVGDFVELSALKDVYSAATDEKQFCAVGSVKSQIGHTKGAAGAAGMIKVALALHQKVLPPTINVQEPRKAVDFPDSPFYVNTTSRPWLLDAARPVRRAALSSFGFGGTNFHCVLEEHDPAGTGLRTLHQTSKVHVWHAADATALLSTVDENPAGVPGAVPAGHARLAVVARDDRELAALRAEAVARLKTRPEAFELPGVYYASRAQTTGKAAALFAGQGSQYVGMGAATALGTPAVRAEFDAMSLAFGKAGSLARAVFPPPPFDQGTKSDQDAALRRTEHAQPAIGALSAGQFRFLRELGLRVDGALGHSFGELTALWAAGALDDDAFRTLAVARGLAMAGTPGTQADRGTMAAVHAAPEAFAETLAAHPDVVVCNLNAPEQTVVGGGTDAVRAFVEAVQQTGVNAQLLPVAAAFHTSYVAHAVDDFRSTVSTVDLRQPDIAVYPNTDGAEYGADAAANRAVLVDQLLHPVAFAPRVRQMYDEGYRTFIEFGPKAVLSGLVRKVLGEDADITVLAADAGPKGDGDRALKQLVARLVVLGFPLTEPNRYAAAIPVLAPGKGMTIPLNGVNHVPEARRKAYRDMLDNGYRIGRSTVDRPERDMEKTMPGQPLSVGATANEHLSLHRDYLNSQLRVAERLSNLLSDHGEPSDNVINGISAVTQHSVAIGQSHVHASEVLRAFAYLEAGAPVPTDYAPPPAEVHYSNANGSYSRPPQEITAGPPAITNGNGHHPVAAQPVVAEPAPAVPEPAVPAVSADEVTPESVRQVLLQSVAEKTGYPADMIDPGMDIEADLGIDSIKRVEIMGALRERFPGGAMPSPEQMGELRTLDDIVSMIIGEVALAPKADGASGITRMPARLIQLPPADELVGGYAGQPVALVVGAGSLAERTGQALRDADWTVHIGQAPDGRLDLVLDFVTEQPVDWAEASGALAGSLILAGRTQAQLAAAAADHRAAFVTVTRIDGALGFSGTDETRAVLGGLPGLVKTLAIEAPALFCRSVDLAPDLADERAVELLLAELHDGDAGLTQVGIAADGGRSTVDVEPGGTGGEELPPPGTDDLLVVTGGARGVTAACAIGLAKEFQAGLLLIGRTPLDAEEPGWAAGVPVDRLRAAIAAELRGRGEKPTPRDVERIFRDLAAQREVRDTLAEIRGTGAFVDYLSFDITDREATGQGLTGYRDRITGIVHGAGVLADQLIADKRAEDVARVLEVKLTGLRRVLDVVDESRLRHVLLFSSVAGFFGNRGQADYAMANEALNRIAVSLRRRLPATRVTSINWGAWAGGMVTPELQRMFHERGVPLIPLARGVEMFVEQFTRADVVCVIGPDTPLSSRELTPRRLVLRRDIRALAAEPALADHALDGAPVLPATAAIGAILGAVHRVEARPAALLRRFSVLSGLVLDGSAPESLEFELAPGAGCTAVTVRSVDSRPRYRAEVAHGLPAAARITGLPDLNGGEPAEAYDGGALFHGPSLQGIHRVLADDDRLVLQCRLPVTPFGAGAYGTDQYHPLLADLLLQAALVRVFRSSGQRSLPSGVGEVEVHAAIAADEPFLVVVSDVRTALPTVRCDVTACAPDGTVLLRFRDVEVVTSAALAAKFAATS